MNLPDLQEYYKNIYLWNDAIYNKKSQVFKITKTGNITF